MGYVTTKDGVEIFYKDWGPRDAKAIHFHHGWPLSADDWDAQLLYFLARGYRVIAHDRRGHGRSSQVWDGHDMDHYADDVAAVVNHLGSQGAVHVGHSTGGGEVVRYLTRHPQDKVPKAVLISAVPPLMVQTEATPAACRNRCSMVSRPRSRPTARSSSTMCPPGRSTATTGLGRKRTKG
jgi:non-heme chloroperoxidase